MRYVRRIGGISVLVLVAAALSNAQDAKKSRPAPKTPNYYPLEAGNEWQFKVTTNGKFASIVNRISRIEVIHGEKLARLESSSINLTEHLTQTDQGVFRNRLKNAAISPPFKLLPYPATPGTKWQGVFTKEKMPGKHQYSGEILKEETVEVPAGKHTALRVVIKLEDEGAMIETTYWFVKNVGIVKQSFESGGLSVLLELEKFDKKK